jgi:hypothetical protein
MTAAPNRTNATTMPNTENPATALRVMMGMEFWAITGESDTVGVTLDVTEVLDVSDSVGVREAVTDFDRVRDGVIEMLSVTDGVTDGVSVGDAVTEAVSEGLGVSDGDFVTEIELVDDREGVRV